VGPDDEGHPLSATRGAQGVKRSRRASGVM
jgi:hypothetical protein